MKRVFLFASLALLLLVVLGCQPISPTADIETTGTPSATGTASAAETPSTTMTSTTGVTATTEISPAMTVTPSSTVTSTEEITSTQEITDEQAGFPEAVFTAVEYEFQGPANIPGGWTRIVLDNQGELAHDINLVKLGEGRTIDDVMTVLQEESEGPPEWVELYGGIEAGPGERNSYLINLPPGEYVYLSFGAGEDGPDDAQRGMVNALTVDEAEGDDSAISLPSADVTVDLVDYAFAISGEIVAGEQMFHVRNVGEEPHHMLFFRLHEGVTYEDFLPFLESEESAEPPPADYYGGMSDIVPGAEVYFTPEFEPGQYVFICFLPSEEHDGAPHFALGMVQQVEVE